MLCNTCRAFLACALALRHVMTSCTHASGGRHACTRSCMRHTAAGPLHSTPLRAAPGLRCTPCGTPCSTPCRRAAIAIDRFYCSMPACTLCCCGGCSFPPSLAPACMHARTGPHLICLVPHMPHTPHTPHTPHGEQSLLQWTTPLSCPYPVVVVLLGGLSSTACRAARSTCEGCEAARPAPLAGCSHCAARAPLRACVGLGASPL